MGGNRISQGSQYRRDFKLSNTTLSIFSERRSQIFQFWNEKGLIYLDQAFLMLEIVESSNSRSERVACASDIKKI